MNEVIAAALKDVIAKRYGVDITPEFVRPDSQFGDLSTNVSMRLAGQLKRKPQDIAKELTESLAAMDDVLAVSVAGPGFINIKLSDQALVDLLGTTPSSSASLKGQVIVTETNNPNPFKDLHIGHAYNCIIADTIANLQDVGGAQVHRVSYHGDVGLHVGRSMWAIMQWCDGDISRLETVPEGDRPSFMSERYVEGAVADKEDLAAKEQIEAYAKQSFAPKGDYKIVYDMCKQWSFDYLTATVERLGSKPVEKRYLESVADVVGVKTVRDHIGEVFAESNGAVVFAGEAFGLHTRVFIASRGTGLYEARDLGLMQLKNEDFHPAKSYIVTAEEQKEYFKVVIKAAELALPELNGVTQNISTGTVKLSTGKMSSRTGEILNIEWLFEQLQNALTERGGSKDDTATLIGALRYSMLKVRIGSDVIFDVNSALSLEGNSGPYLQYAHARARSILAKTDRTPLKGDEPFDEWERVLLVKLSEYPEALTAAVADLLPHYITTYLYELAQDFNRFYEHSRVIGDDREELRLWLVSKYAETLKAGLSVLGIPAPEKL
jgi:arginyl-tRNA synthetase